MTDRIRRNERLKKIKCLIKLQMEYLDNVLNDKISDQWFNPDKAGFYRMSLEVYKQVNKLKKNND